MLFVRVCVCCKRRGSEEEEAAVNGKQATGHLQGELQTFVDFHDCSLVSAAVAIVWRAEDGDHQLLMAPVEALKSISSETQEHTTNTHAIHNETYVHHKLVCSGNQLYVVVMVELLTDILAEGVPEFTHQSKNKSLHHHPYTSNLKAETQQKEWLPGSSWGDAPAASILRI